MSLGAACSCKNTAWGLMPLDGFVHILELFLENNCEFDSEAFFELVIRGCSIGFGAIMVYLLSFAIHFILLPFSGQGDQYLTYDMRPLILPSDDGELTLWSQRVSSHDLIYSSIKLSIIMHIGNMEITQFHPYQSRPIGWPLLTDIYVAFWSSEGKEVVCIGNVFSYYLAFIGVVSVIFGYKNKKWLVALRFVLGWAFCYFPFFLIPRAMYLYHYLIPLLLGARSYGSAIDIFISKQYRGSIAVLSCFLCFMGFVLWSPYVYGYDPWDKHVTIWNDNWQYGDSHHRILAEKEGKSQIRSSKGLIIL